MNTPVVYVATRHHIDHTHFHPVAGNYTATSDLSSGDVSWGQREPDCWDRLASALQELRDAAKAGQ